MMKLILLYSILHMAYSHMLKKKIHLLEHQQEEDSSCPDIFIFESLHFDPFVASGTIQVYGSNAKISSKKDEYEYDYLFNIILFSMSFSPPISNPITTRLQQPYSHDVLKMSYTEDSSNRQEVMYFRPSCINRNTSTVIVKEFGTLSYVCEVIPVTNGEKYKYLFTLDQRLLKSTLAFEQDNTTMEHSVHVVVRRKRSFFKKGMRRSLTFFHDNVIGIIYRYMKRTCGAVRILYHHSLQRTRVYALSSRDSDSIPILERKQAGCIKKEDGVMKAKCKTSVNRRLQNEEVETNTTLPCSSILMQRDGFTWKTKSHKTGIIQLFAASNDPTDENDEINTSLFNMTLLPQSPPRVSSAYGQTNIPLAFNLLRIVYDISSTKARNDRRVGEAYFAATCRGEKPSLFTFGTLGTVSYTCTDLPHHVSCESVEYAVKRNALVKNSVSSHLEKFVYEKAPVGKFYKALCKIFDTVTKILKKFAARHEEKSSSESP